MAASASPHADQLRLVAANDPITPWCSNDSFLSLKEGDYGFADGAKGARNKAPSGEARRYLRMSRVSSWPTTGSI